MQYSKEKTLEAIQHAKKALAGLEGSVESMTHGSIRAAAIAGYCHSLLMAELNSVKINLDQFALEERRDLFTLLKEAEGEHVPEVRSELTSEDHLTFAAIRNMVISSGHDFQYYDFDLVCVKEAHGGGGIIISTYKNSLLKLGRVGFLEKVNSWILKLGDAALTERVIVTPALDNSSDIVQLTKSNVFTPGFLVVL